MKNNKTHSTIDRETLPPLNTVVLQTNGLIVCAACRHSWIIKVLRGEIMPSDYNTCPHCKQAHKTLRLSADDIKALKRHMRNRSRQRSGSSMRLLKLMAVEGEIKKLAKES